MDTNIMIVAGEASGDLHGANLIRALQACSTNKLTVSGMGGPELCSAGVKILLDATKVAVVGVFEVLTHLKDILNAQRILRKELEVNPPDLLILVDLPDFNLPLAKKAKKLGIPVFYYIAPQAWAWRPSRVKTIKERVDALGVILPFEEQFFGERGLTTQYVGHPLLDSVRLTKTRSEFQAFYGIDKNNRMVGLLPGSRKREISSLLPTFLAAADIMQCHSTHKITFLVPKAAMIEHSDLEAAGLTEYQERLDIRVIENDRYNLMASCDCVVAASGTVTLELAILQTPMIVTYKLSPLTYRLGKILVDLDNFALVNLIAGYTAVPELLQDDVSPDRIAKELSLLLNVYSRKSAMKRDLALVKEKLGKSGASQNAAQMVLDVLGKKNAARSGVS